MQLRLLITEVAVTDWILNMDSPSSAPKAPTSEKGLCQPLTQITATVDELKF